MSNETIIKDGEHYIEVNGQLIKIEPITVAIGALTDAVQALLPEGITAEDFSAALTTFTNTFLDLNARTGYHFLASTYQVAERRLDDHEQRIERLEEQAGNG